MARKQKRGDPSQRPIEAYEHRDKDRVNNPPVGLVTPETDPDTGQKKKTYAYDPPYGIKYGSNFQPFVNKRDVKDGKDEDLTAEARQGQSIRGRKLWKCR